MASLSFIFYAEILFTAIILNHNEVTKKDSSKHIICQTGTDPGEVRPHPSSKKKYPLFPITNECFRIPHLP
jgi:hypothetical protein